MKTPSVELLAAAKRANVGTWRRLAALVALLPSFSACEVGTGTETLVALVHQLEVEPNDTAATANPLTVFSFFGSQLEEALANGAITPPGDVDLYSFAATNLASGDSIFVWLFAKNF